MGTYRAYYRTFNNPASNYFTEDTVLPEEHEDITAADRDEAEKIAKGKCMETPTGGRMLTRIEEKK